MSLLRIPAGNPSPGPIRLPVHLKDMYGVAANGVVPANVRSTLTLLFTNGDKVDLSIDGTIVQWEEPLSALGANGPGVYNAVITQATAATVFTEARRGLFSYVIAPGAGGLEHAGYLGVATIDDLPNDAEFLRRIARNRWKIDRATNTLYFYKEDNTTVLISFPLKDDQAVASVDRIYERSAGADGPGPAPPPPDVTRPTVTSKTITNPSGTLIQVDAFFSEAVQNVNSESFIVSIVDNTPPTGTLQTGTLTLPASNHAQFTFNVASGFSGWIHLALTTQIQDMAGNRLVGPITFAQLISIGS